MNFRPEEGGLKVEGSVAASEVGWGGSRDNGTAIPLRPRPRRRGIKKRLNAPRVPVPVRSGFERLAAAAAAVRARIIDLETAAGESV